MLPREWQTCQDQDGSLKMKRLDAVDAYPLTDISFIELWNTGKEKSTGSAPL